MYIHKTLLFVSCRCVSAVALCLMCLLCMLNVFTCYVCLFVTLGATYCTRDNSSSESVVGLSGTFEWMLVGIFQRMFICRVACPKGVSLFQWMFTGIVNDIWVALLV